MNFILYIKSTEEQDFNYSNPFYDLLKKEIPNTDFFDLDNFSGQDLIDMAAKAIKAADKSSIIFDLEPKSTTNKFLGLATQLADEPERKKVFINGTDSIISKMLFPLENFSYHNLPQQEIVEEIKRWFEE